MSLNGRNMFWMASRSTRDALDGFSAKANRCKLVSGFQSWMSASLGEALSTVSGFGLKGHLIVSPPDPKARVDEVSSINGCHDKLALGHLKSETIGSLGRPNGE